MYVWVCVCVCVSLSLGLSLSLSLSLPGSVTVSVSVCIYLPLAPLALSLFSFCLGVFQVHQLYLHRRPLALPWVSIADVNINSLPNLNDISLFQRYTTHVVKSLANGVSAYVPLAHYLVEPGYEYFVAWLQVYSYVWAL